MPDQYGQDYSQLRPGVEVWVYYQDIPTGTRGVIRKVMNRHGVISVRIPISQLDHDLPASTIRRFTRDPGDLSVIPIVLIPGEYEVVSTTVRRF